MGNNRSNVPRFDVNIAFLLFLFFCVSCIGIYSAQSSGQYSENFLVKQIIWYIVSAGIAFSVMLLDSDQIQKLSWYAYGFGLLLLIILFVAPNTSFTPIRNGAQSWFVFPGIGSIQPSEFVKVFLIMVLSNVITKHNEKYRIRNFREDFLLLLKMFLTIAPAIILLISDDLGTTLVLIAIFVGLVFVSGISWKIIVPVFASISIFAGAVLSLVIFAPSALEKYLGVDPYQLTRIYSWLDPRSYSGEGAYHLLQSLMAIGSGMVEGKGFSGEGVYVPEGHTDFIFAIIAEDFGFIGGSIVISLFFVLIYYLVKLGQETKEPFNSYLCVGVISMITFHVFQNIGMTIQVIPITGIPLPFISYGGSSLMGNMLAMGLMLGVSYHYKRYMFSSNG
ncbi:FtsW/RodA/SpoVE family cell cycle protein [Priestia endophytica]|uniref:Rod shape-determining protein RodA n=1 Tax=Priestia endophytica TaxID=135735 RepID=A0AAX1Q2L3_9BACI|nr:FtsW/RodA/SpoVE family cell cycle protein [Priestia endophytica]RAS71894.1 rod shape-determining protein RodA [Priestia endophytica]RAS92019.1 rod shape-determining protein RodA [Priestia endophytica]